MSTSSRLSPGGEDAYRGGSGQPPAPRDLDPLGPWARPLTADDSEEARMKTIAERIANLSSVTDSGCWEWQGRCDRDGYPLIKIGGRNGRPRAAHRVSYLEHVGPIPEGFEVDHLCRVTKCVNPDHLEAVTGRVNRERAGIFSESHCRNGHPRTVSSTYVSPNGARSCRVCHAEAVRRYRRAA